MTICYSDLGFKFGRMGEGEKGIMSNGVNFPLMSVKKEFNYSNFEITELFYYNKTKNTRGTRPKIRGKIAYFSKFKNKISSNNPFILHFAILTFHCPYHRRRRYC